MATTQRRLNRLETAAVTGSVPRAVIRTVLGTVLMTVAMTYESLAERLGINVASTRKLVLRRRWARSTGNNGCTVVQVPEEFLQCRDDGPTDSPSLTAS
jgi:hypothetical protein